MKRVPIDGADAEGFVVNQLAHSYAGTEILMRPNPLRMYAIIQNPGSEDLAIALFSGGGSTETIILRPTETLHFDYMSGRDACEWTGLVQGVGGSAAQAQVTEVSRSERG